MNKSRRAGIGCIGAVVCFVLLVVIVDAIHGPSNSLFTGQEGHLESSGDIIMTDTQESFQAVTRAALANDDQGIQALVLGGHVTMLKSGTRVRCLDLGADCSQIRVLDGPHSDAAGWVASKFLRKD